MRFLTLFSAVGLILLTSAHGVVAETLPSLTGPILLRIDGVDPVRFPGGHLDLDLPMLQAIDATTFSTGTIWTEGSHEYTGVSLQALVQTVGIIGDTLTLQAMNDYSVEVPVSDAVPGGPIIAYFSDGAPMSVREMGPLWLIYPYDSDPDFQTDVIYSRSIWQLDRILISP